MTNMILRGNKSEPKLSGNSQQRRELHPAAAEAAARYSQVWEENDSLRAENDRLRNELDVSRNLDVEKTALLSDLRQTLADSQARNDDRMYKIEAHFRERLAESERNKERYLRYATAIAERLKGITDQIVAAHSAAMDMASAEHEQADVKHASDGVAQALRHMIDAATDKQPEQPDNRDGDANRS
jgi:regulator of replication initiation timing